MKSLFMTGLGGGILTAITAAGLPAVACLGIILLIAIGAVCWVITNRDRTANAVALITACRNNSADLNEPLPENVQVSEDPPIAARALTMQTSNLSAPDLEEIDSERSA